MKIKQLLCAVRRHKFERTDIKCEVKNNIVIVTQTCQRCGKQFIFTVPEWGNNMTKAERDKEIARLFRNGYKLAEIADKLDMNIPQVKYRLKVIRQSQEVKRWWE